MSIYNTDAGKELMELIFAGKICPYCKSSAEYITDSTPVYFKDYGPLYICWKCMAYCGVHKGEPKKSLGRLANAELRQWKKKAHEAFDPIWKSNYKSRGQAYEWLSNQLKIPGKYTHIGYFGVETCKRVVELCKNELL